MMAAPKTIPLNCIVDDSALVASVRQGSQHSVQPWLSQGAINIYVPISGMHPNHTFCCTLTDKLLAALGRLNALRNINCPVRDDAQTALQWLDDITTITASHSEGRVELQGPDDQYRTWQEVERYLLPDTPFSRTNGQGQQRIDALSKMIDRGLNVSDFPSSTRTLGAKHSPSASLVSSTSSMESTEADVLNDADESSMVLSAHGIPPAIRPLLNFIVWRTHYQENVTFGSQKYILVTNDPIIQKQASKFGVRAKLLGQLANILAKEGIKPQKANGLQPAHALSSDWGDSFKDPNQTFDVPDEVRGHHKKEDVKDQSDDEDQVVFDPSKRPGSSRGQANAANKLSRNTLNVIDPEHFGRNNDYTKTAGFPIDGTMNAFPYRNGREGSKNNRGHALAVKQSFRGTPQSSHQRGRGNRNPSNQVGCSTVAQNAGTISSVITRDGKDGVAPRNLTAATTSLQPHDNYTPSQQPQELPVDHESQAKMQSTAEVPTQSTPVTNFSSNALRGRGGAHFSNPGPVVGPQHIGETPSQPVAPRGRASHRGSPRGSRANRNVQPHTGRGGSASSGGPGSINGIPTGPRAGRNWGARATRANAFHSGRAMITGARSPVVPKAIDPNSFARPRTYGGRGRGAAIDRLWNPDSHG